MTFFKKQFLWVLALAIAGSTVGVVQAKADDHDRHDRDWNKHHDRDHDRDRRYNGNYNNGRSYPYSGNYGYYGGNSPYYGGYAQNNDTQRAYQAGYNNGVNDRMRNKSLNLRTGNWRGINLQAYDRGYQDGYRGGSRGWR